MTRKERLMATLAGKPVDRPAFNFYEINGTENLNDPDPFNIYNDPSWKPLIDLAREKTDRIVMRSVGFKDIPPDPLAEITTTEEYTDGDGSRHTHTCIKLPDRTLTRHLRRDPKVNTNWQTEHLLKTADDLKAWLDLPEPEFGGEPGISGFLAVEKELGNTGIVMIDTADPLCLAADLFPMSEYTIVALTEQKLFHRACERFAKILHRRTEEISRALPGRLWRIFGPEYAAPPYLPPPLFEEYVVKYDLPMVKAIQRHGGYARIHSHGNLQAILGAITDMGADGLDPIEPPPQGDVELSYVRQKYGQQLVLFGNLEASDIENLATLVFEKKVERALKEGTAGNGRGFVLMPSACPYGRNLSALTLKNYEAMVRLAER
jgi:hypothetical protein